MTYEEENQEYKQRLEMVKVRISLLEDYFQDKQNLYNREMEKLPRYALMIDQFRHEFTPEFYELFKLRMEKGELERKLNQSKFQRKREKASNFIGGITPQHVSGRIYKVQDSEGCDKFILWFVIIDAIIVFLLYALGVFKK